MIKNSLVNYYLSKKMNIVFSLFCALLFCSCNNNNSHPSDPFDWLLGDWERMNETAGKATFESWQKISKNQYNGFGFTLQNKDTVWKEHIQLIHTENNWNFEVSMKENSTPTMFKLTQIDKEKFVCENKENDFPNIIEYQKVGEKLKAKISGGGNEIPFEFNRIQNK